MRDPGPGGLADRARIAGSRTGTAVSPGGGQAPPTNGRPPEEEEGKEEVSPRPKKQATSGEEAETKHSTAARRRSSARPRSAPRPAGPAEGVRGPAAAREGCGGQRSARTAARGQGARVGAAPPRRPGRADAARPHLHLRGPDLRLGLHETAGAWRGGRRGAAEVAEAPGTAGAGPGRPSCCCAAGRHRRPPRCLCCCAALGTADRLLRPPRPGAAPGPAPPIRGAAGPGPPCERLSPTHVTWRRPRRLSQVRNKPGQQKLVAEGRRVGRAKGRKSRVWGPWHWDDWATGEERLGK